MLLINRNRALPIGAGVSNIAVAPAADDLGIQCGGWTISWQGAAGAVTQGRRCCRRSRGLRRSTVTYSPRGDVASGAQVAIIVIGEKPYAEMKGDRPELTLDADDVAAVHNAKRAGVPVVVVLFSGRPLILEPIMSDADAVIAAWLPGTEGDGIADVLFGKYHPTGKLSVTWPRSMAQVPIGVGPNGEKPSGALFDYGFQAQLRQINYGDSHFLDLSQKADSVPAALNEQRRRTELTGRTGFLQVFHNVTQARFDGRPGPAGPMDESRS